MLFDPIEEHTPLAIPIVILTWEWFVTVGT